MLPLKLLPFVLPIVASPTVVEVGAGSEAGVRAGLLPLDAISPATPAAEATFALYAGTLVHSERTSFHLNYSPRVYVRQPNVAGLSRPLLLHRMNSAYSTNLSPRLAFVWDFDGGAGELAYTDLYQVFNPGSGATQSRIIPVAYYTTSSSLDWTMTPRDSSRLLLRSGYRTPLDDISSQGEGTATPFFPTSFDAGVSVTQTRLVSRQDQLALTLSSTYYLTERIQEEESVTDNIGSNQATLLFRHDQSDSTYYTAMGGANIVYTEQDDRWVIFPVFGISHASAFLLAHRTFRSNLASGLRGFFDPITAQYRPQAFVSYDITAELGHSLMGGMTAFASTSADPEPINSGEYESIASLEIPFTYRLSQSTRLRMGARAATRAPHFRSWNALPLQHELAAFVAIMATMGTGSSNGSWLR